MLLLQLNDPLLRDARNRLGCFEESCDGFTPLVELGNVLRSSTFGFRFWFWHGRNVPLHRCRVNRVSSLRINPVGNRLQERVNAVCCSVHQSQNHSALDGDFVVEVVGVPFRDNRSFLPLRDVLAVHFCVTVDQKMTQKGVPLQSGIPRRVIDGSVRSKNSIK